MSTNYHPSDTTEIVKSEFVTELETRYVSDLNAGGERLQNLSRQLRLSSGARVWVKTRDNRNRGIEGQWLIMDGKQNFLISRNGNRLEVYKRPTIENCALEYSYFLEIDPPSNIDKIDFPRYIQPPEPNLIVRLRERQTQQLLQFAKQGIKLYCVDATVDWRLVVGLGSEHVQETNMTLHHIYGIPYIPGSAVKGVLRHWWLQENEDFVDNKGKINEDMALKNIDFLTVFGSQEQRGEVQFLDAYPEEVHFATDIMNPHYPDYYGGGKPPTDHQNPVPINFLTVEETTFRFVFLAKDQDPLDKLKDRFQMALELKGVGAKTSVGYGYFRDFKDQTDDITDELKRQQAEPKRAAEAQRRPQASQQTPEPRPTQTLQQPKEPEKPKVKVGDRVNATILKKGAIEVTVQLQTDENEELIFEGQYYPGKVGATVKLRVTGVDAEGKINKVVP